MKVKKALKEIKKAQAKKQATSVATFAINYDTYDLYKKIHDAHFKI